MSVESVGEVMSAEITSLFLSDFVFTSSTVPKWVHHAIKPVVLALEKYIPQPYAGEIRGLASYFGDSLSDVIILNFAYEISAYVSPQDVEMGDPCAQCKCITVKIYMPSQVLH